MAMGTRANGGGRKDESFTIGARVEVRWTDGRWYTAVVCREDPGDGKGTDEDSDRTIDGDESDGKFQGGKRKAVSITSETARKLKVSFEDGSWDRVEAKNLRRPFQEGECCQAKWHGKWYDAYVEKQIGPRKYRVGFSQDNSFEFVGLNSIRAKRNQQKSKGITRPRGTGKRKTRPTGRKRMAIDEAAREEVHHTTHNLGTSQRKTRSIGRRLMAIDRAVAAEVHHTTPNLGTSQIKTRSIRRKIMAIDRRAAAEEVHHTTHKVGTSQKKARSMGRKRMAIDGAVWEEVHHTTHSPHLSSNIHREAMEELQKPENARMKKILEEIKSRNFAFIEADSKEGQKGRALVIELGDFIRMKVVSGKRSFARASTIDYSYTHSVHGNNTARTKTHSQSFLGIGGSVAEEEMVCRGLY